MITRMMNNSFRVRVLIETLWNVNIKNVRFPPVQLLRINRNIVECKFRINRNPLVLITVLIETLWNVNKTQILLQELSALVLIETLWNVNFIAQTFIDTCGYVLIETLWNVNFHNAHCFLQ